MACEHAEIYTCQACFDARQRVAAVLHNPRPNKLVPSKKLKLKALEARVRQLELKATGTPSTVGKQEETVLDLRRGSDALLLVMATYGFYHLFSWLTCRL